jgi:hypothetical protein
MIVAQQEVNGNHPEGVAIRVNPDTSDGRSEWFFPYHGGTARFGGSVLLRWETQ